MTNFKNLLSLITVTQDQLQQSVLQQTNNLLTVRNWLIGFYIFEYQQDGQDRAKYGENLIQELAEELKSKKRNGFSETNLRLYRQFYLTYPQIHQSLTDKFIKSNLKFLESDIHKNKAQLNISSHSPKSEILLRHFTFTHFVELIKVQDPLKRAFYEVEGINGHWNVRQLKRQIQSLLYERTGLSKNKHSLLEKTHSKDFLLDIKDTIKDPYILEFTALEERPEFSENDLETALLNHIQEFLLELGTGFCFEARQKRITIDNEHDRIDLIFYHRILKCHVLVDLKIRAFSHQDVGQMNFI